ncbi:MAG: IS110 family transposase [Gemmatimonadaceae bacterium]|nr:IS110 family transposase [Gemmatimonadaceae bacterium]NUQ91675.1 IS110 family transposase [Gemmatimonadaceae bacterium]NUR35733.1 IS110 family transposase [Gemmatimonadaceae bacterium]
MTPDEKIAYARSFTAHVGVDTGKVSHAVVVSGPDGRRSKPFTVKIGRADFDEADAQIRRLAPPDTPREKVLVGLEFAGQYGYTFAHDLARRGYPIVNVLPTVTKRMKEVEDNSPLKTDGKDATLIARLVAEGKFVRFPFLDPTYAALRHLAVNRHRLGVEGVRYKNRLQSLLDLGWPEFLPVFKENLMAKTPMALLARWPLPEDLLGAPLRTVMRVAREASRNHIDRDRIRALLASARETVGVRTGADERRREMLQVLDRLALVREQIAEVELWLAAAIASCPPARALATVPEVGTVCAATIVSELGMPDDYEHPRQVLKLAGMNLVEKSSGLHKGRKRQSKRGRPLLRRQLYLLAGRWCQRRGIYRAYYEALVARNGGHKTKAVCAVARKLVPMLLAVMQSGEPFDRARWEAARLLPRVKAVEEQ